MPRVIKRVFNPASTEPFKISRSKIDLYLECPRCFWLDLRSGISRPSFPAFTLNSAVDVRLKKEFAIHRAQGEPHPLMKEYGIDAVPYSHPDLETWRHTFTGIQYQHEPTNFLVFGGIDDVWVNPKGELHIVDYKATAKNERPTLDGKWQQGYKRQMEVYQWLFRKNDFKVSPIGYFVYVNGRRDAAAFDGKLEFDVDIIAYEGDNSWIESTLLGALETLKRDSPPPASNDCEYCLYQKATKDFQ